MPITILAGAARLPSVRRPIRDATLTTCNRTLALDRRLHIHLGTKRSSLGPLTRVALALAATEAQSFALKFAITPATDDVEAVRSRPQREVVAGVGGRRPRTVIVSFPASRAAEAAAVVAGRVAVNEAFQGVP